MKATTKNYDQLWEQFKLFLKSEIGWYSTDNMVLMTAQQFVEIHGANMSDKFKTFMLENVTIVNRQCDSYAIYFKGETIPETK